MPKYGFAHDAIGVWDGWAYITGVDLGSGKKRPATPSSRQAWRPTGSASSWTSGSAPGLGPDLLREPAKVDAIFHPTAIFVESNAYQETFADFARDKTEYFSLSSRLRDYQTPGTVHTDEYLGIKFLDGGV